MTVGLKRYQYEESGIYLALFLYSIYENLFIFIMYSFFYEYTISELYMGSRLDISNYYPSICLTSVHLNRHHSTNLLLM